MSKEMFVPLLEAGCLCDGRVRVSLGLQYGLDEKIEISAGQIDNLRQIGGFRSISITRDDESGTSQVIPQIDGINSDGTATLSKAIIKTVPEGSFDFKNDGKILTNRAYWPDLKVKVNVPEIQQRILDSRNSVQNNSIWSKELDKTVRNNILKGGTKHLLPKLSQQSMYEKMCSVWFYGGLPMLDLLNHDNMRSVVLNYLFLYVIWHGTDTLKYGRVKKGKGFRWSLTFGPEIERAIALNVCGRFGALFRAAQDIK